MKLIKIIFNWSVIYIICELIISNIHLNLLTLDCNLLVILLLIESYSLFWIILINFEFIYIQFRGRLWGPDARRWRLWGLQWEIQQGTRTRHGYEYGKTVQQYDAWRRRNVLTMISMYWNSVKIELTNVLMNLLTCNCRIMKKRIFKNILSFYIIERTWYVINRFISYKKFRFLAFKIII